MLWMLCVTFRDSVNLGSVILAAVVGIPGIIGLFYGAKWKAAADVAEETGRIAEQGREAYRRAAERLGAEKDQANAQMAVLEAKVKHMESFPFGDQVADLVAKTLDRLDSLGAERTRAAAAQLAKQHEEIEARMISSFDLHEQRAQERHDAQMKVAADQAEVNQAMLRALSRIMGELRRQP